MTISAHTRASGSTPNEDWFAATDDLVVVLDGATIRTETGCTHGLPWYVRHLGTALVAEAGDHSTGLTEALTESIRQVSAAHEATCDLAHPGTPSAAVGVVRRRAGTVEWLVLGDITVMVETPTNVLTICDNRVSHTATDERRECDRHLIGTDAKLAAILAMKDIELASRNRPGGYWIASSEPDAAEHAKTGSTPQEQVRAVGVCSDGAMRLFDLTKISTAAGAMRILRLMGPSAMIDQVRSAEYRDPVGARVPRNKAFDDATAVFLEVNAIPEEPPSIKPYRPSPHDRGHNTESLFGANPALDGKVYG